MAPAPIHGRDQDEDDDELSDHAEAHRLVGPGAGEVAAAEQGVDPETERQKNDDQPRRNQEIEHVHDRNVVLARDLRYAPNQLQYGGAWGAGRSLAARLPT